MRKKQLALIWEEPCSVWSSSFDGPPLTRTKPRVFVRSRLGCLSGRGYCRAALAADKPFESYEHDAVKEHVEIYRSVPPASADVLSLMSIESISAAATHTETLCV